MEVLIPSVSCLRGTHETAPLDQQGEPLLSSVTALPCRMRVTCLSLWERCRRRRGRFLPSQSASPPAPPECRKTMSLRGSAHRNRRCHCEPVRRLVWQSPGYSKKLPAERKDFLYAREPEVLPHQCVFRWFSECFGDCHTSVATLVRNDIFLSGLVHNSSS